MNALRALLRAALDQHQHTLMQAADLMGTSQPQLTRLLSGQLTPNIELTLRLAHYLRLPAATALHMAGHDSFIPFIANPTPSPTPAAARFAALIATATPAQIELALSITALVISEKCKVENAK